MFPTPFVTLPVAAHLATPTTTSVRFQGALPATAPINGEVLEQRLRQQLHEYRDLVADGRALQAADVLGSVLEPAGRAFGPDSPRVLELRFDIALARFIGGEFRKARTEFDALAAASARVKGFADELTIQCRKFGADCRIEIGELTEALSGMRAVLDDVRATQSDGSEMALELRLGLGRLLALMGHRAAARGRLSELYEDLLLVRGGEDPLTQEAAEALERFVDDDSAYVGEDE